MMDRDRILAKLDELRAYESELRTILPQEIAEYMANSAKRRAIERLLQISIAGTVSTLSIYHPDI